MRWSLFVLTRLRRLALSRSWGRAKWDGAKWDGAKWGRAKWDRAKWGRAKWGRAKWDGAEWDRAKWDGAKWDRAKWDRYAAEWSADTWTKAATLHPKGERRGQCWQLLPSARRTLPAAPADNSSGTPPHPQSVLRRAASCAVAPTGA